MEQSKQPSRDPQVVAVYLTFPDEKVAQEVSRALVERRLAACVNLGALGTSVYRWEGKVTTEPEVVAWAKTTRGRLPELLRAVEELHPYDVPAAVAYPATGGLAEYLGWVEEETA